MTTLAEIRKKLQALESKRSGNFSSGDNSNFPFWNMANDTSSTIRFLPDKDESNTFFWVEKQVIRLTFPGIKGEDENKQVTVTVPCMEMWNETCPIHTEIRPWFKDDSLAETARSYWKKRSYIFQGFVQKASFNEENEPENPIRKFTISPQIFKIIKAALMDPDWDNLPTDYMAGTDFIISKTQKGQYADYSTSKYARKESPLNQEQLSAIDEHGLHNLADFLPKKPTSEQLAAIYEMFEASVAGELYDPDKWAQYYRPFGLEYEKDSKSTTETKAESKDETKVTVESANTPTEDDTPPFDVDEPKAEAAAPESADTSGKSAQDILAMIRNRNNG